jgi:hypothetical protein
MHNQISWLVFIFQEECFQTFKKFKEKSLNQQNIRFIMWVKV